MFASSAAARAQGVAGHPDPASERAKGVGAAAADRVRTLNLPREDMKICDDQRINL